MSDKEQHNPHGIHATVTGFSPKGQLVLFALVIFMGVVLLTGTGLLAWKGYQKYVADHVTPPQFDISAQNGAGAVKTDKHADPDEENGSLFGSVLMVPRQGDEVVHSAIALPNGNLAVVMFPGFSASSAGRPPAKKDPDNTADGGRIMIWNPPKGHIVQEMRISSAPPPIRRD